MRKKSFITIVVLVFTGLAAGGVNYFDLNDDEVEDHIEPSGLIYVPELGHNLLVSDETGDESEATIFSMTSRGKVLSKFSISGSKKMSDIESIARDKAGNFYLLSSLSPKKNGEVKKKRGRFLKFKRVGNSYETVSSINLYKLLNQVAVANPSKPWSQLLLNYQEDKVKVDIEGMLIKDNTLYFALRRMKSFKKLKDHFVMIKIKNISHTLESNTLGPLQMAIHAKFPFPIENYYKDEGVSDLALIKGSLYVLTVNNSGANGGRLLKMSLSKPSGSTVVLKRFVGLKPEGITYDSKIKKIIITCDQGIETSRVIQL